MTVTALVRDALKTLEEGTVISVETVRALGSREALNQVLSHLTRNGELMRIARGLHVVPVHGKFGTYPPSPDKVVRSYAKSKGQTVVPNGPVAANRLGLSTQQPIRQVYLTSGRTTKFKLGSASVELRHAPEWQLLFPDCVAGEVIRALVYVGKAGANESALKLRRRLDPKEWEKLKRARSTFPMWLTEAILAADEFLT